MSLFFFNRVYSMQKLCPFYSDEMVCHLQFWDIFVFFVLIKT